jgi:hypothetical protein
MKVLFVTAIMLASIGFTNAQAPQPAQHPTAEQYSQQILENENRSYRQQMGVMAERLDKLTQENNELKAKLPAEPAKPVK